MKNVIIAALSTIMLLSCQERTKKEDIPVETVSQTEIEKKKAYPPALGKVFDAHGGIDKWRSMKYLSFEIPNTGYKEIHTINLYSREDRVDTPDYAMGFDGKEVWIQDLDEKYTGDPVFYHNLMFYFYAMPFVLADKGIIYSETEDLKFNGKNYPGVGIGYRQDVGTSPKDQYYVHYDPDTFQMAWLGYTVTYRTGEKSENVKWIRYDDWLETSGLLLPSAITWYDYEGRRLKEPKSTVRFDNAQLSEEAREASFFEKPEGAKPVKPSSPNQ